MTKHNPHRAVEILEYITRHPAATVREIMDAVGLASTAAVAHHLDRLIQRGFLERDDCPHCGGHSRWLAVTDAGRNELAA